MDPHINLPRKTIINMVRAFGVKGGFSVGPRQLRGSMVTNTQAQATLNGSTVDWAIINILGGWSHGSDVQRNSYMSATGLMAFFAHRVRCPDNCIVSVQCMLKCEAYYVV